MRCLRGLLCLRHLDAELLQTLAAGFSNENLREIHVVTLDHRIVTGRVRLLLDPRRSVRLVGHDVTDIGNIENETVYA